MDEAERLVHLSLSSGQTSGSHSCASMIEQAASEKEVKTICDDKGYDSKTLRVKIRESGMRSVILKKGNSRQSSDFCHESHRQQNLIDRFIDKLKENTRMAIRYDKTASNL